LLASKAFVVKGRGHARGRRRTRPAAPGVADYRPGNFNPRAVALQLQVAAGQSVMECSAARSNADLRMASIAGPPSSAWRQRPRQRQHRPVAPKGRPSMPGHVAYRRCCLLPRSSLRPCLPATPRRSLSPCSEGQRGRQRPQRRLFSSSPTVPSHSKRWSPRWLPEGRRSAGPRRSPRSGVDIVLDDRFDQDSQALSRLVPAEEQHRRARRRPWFGGRRQLDVDAVPEQHVLAPRPAGRGQSDGRHGTAQLSRPAAQRAGPRMAVPGDLAGPVEGAHQGRVAEQEGSQARAGTRGS